MAFFYLKNHNQIDSPNCAAQHESVQIIQINLKLFWMQVFWEKSFHTFKKQICFRHIQLIAKRHTCVLHSCAGLKLYPNLELQEVFKFKEVSLTDQGSYLL